MSGGDQWKLYGSSDRSFSNTLQVFFQQILDGMSADELAL